MSLASPQASEAVVNRTMPPMKTRRRPYWSLIRPASGMTMIWPSA